MNTDPYYYETQNPSQPGKDFPLRSLGLRGKGSRRNNFTFCCRPPGPLARRERRAIPGAVCKERATKPAGLRAAALRGAAAGGHLLCCRSSTMSDIDFVAAPRICPPGLRAQM